MAIQKVTFSELLTKQAVWKKKILVYYKGYLENKFPYSPPPAGNGMDEIHTNVGGTGQ
jgi:hypothetical protein